MTDLNWIILSAVYINRRAPYVGSREKAADELRGGKTSDIAIDRSLRIAHAVTKARS